MSTHEKLHSKLFLFSEFGQNSFFFFFSIFILIYSTVYYKSDILIEPIICLMVWDFFFFNLFCFQIHFSFEYWVCTKHLDYHCCNFQLTSFCLFFNGQIICGIWWWRNEAWGDLISTDVRLYITFMPSSLHTSHDISAVHDEQRKICIVLKKLANNLINLCLD